MDEAVQQDGPDEEPITRRYRDDAYETPPMAVDAAILAQARRAARQRRFDPVGRLLIPLVLGSGIAVAALLTVPLSLDDDATAQPPPAPAITVELDPRFTRDALRPELGTGAESSGHRPQRNLEEAVRDSLPSYRQREPVTVEPEALLDQARRGIASGRDTLAGGSMSRLYSAYPDYPVRAEDERSEEPDRP